MEIKCNDHNVLEIMYIYLHIFEEYHFYYTSSLYDNNNCLQYNKGLTIRNIKWAYGSLYYIALQIFLQTK